MNVDQGEERKVFVGFTLVGSSWHPCQAGIALGTREVIKAATSVEVAGTSRSSSSSKLLKVITVSTPAPLLFLGRIMKRETQREIRNNVPEGSASAPLSCSFLCFSMFRGLGENVIGLGCGPGPAIWPTSDPGLALQHMVSLTKRNSKSLFQIEIQFCSKLKNSQLE